MLRLIVKLSDFQQGSVSMSEASMSTSSSVGAQSQSTDYPQVSYGADPVEPSGWVGWVFFAGIMLTLVGVFQVMAGLVALFDKSYYVVTADKLVVHASYTTWGWVHIALGALAIFAGVGVMSGRLWARIYAIALASISAVANLAFINASPVWSVVMITVDVLVIYALAVHGRELAADY
jgi:hypothetical protein